MNCQNFLRGIVIISLVIAICTLLGCSEMDNPSQDVMDDDKTNLAGRVIDTNGAPIPQLALFAEYIKTTQLTVLGLEILENLPKKLV